jgi:hypothetical protein
VTKLNFGYSFFSEATKRTTTVAKIRNKSTVPKTVSGILKVGSESRTVVEGVINIPPRYAAKKMPTKTAPTH